MRRLLFYIASIMFYLSGTIYTMPMLARYQKIMLLLGIALLWFAAGIPLPTRMRIKRSVFEKAYFSFIFFMGVSFYKNMEFSILISLSGMVFIWIAAVKLMPRIRIRGRALINSTPQLICSMFIGVFIACFLIWPIRLSRYTGPFTTANGFGGVAATFCASMIPLFLESIVNEGFKNSTRWYRFGWLMMGVFFTLISTSRTCILVVAFMLAMMLFIILLHLLDNGKKARRIAFVIIAIFVGTIIACNTTYAQDAVENVLTKFAVKAEDPLDGRIDGWMIAISRLSILGHGESQGFGGHNTYLNITDQYGLLAGVSWIAFVAIGLLKSMRIILKKWNRNALELLPFFSFSCFALLSFTEGMMLKTIMMMMMVCVPVIEQIEKENKYKRGSL